MTNGKVVKWKVLLHRTRKLHQFVLNMQENLIKKAIDVDRKDFAKKVDLAEKRQGQIN